MQKSDNQQLGRIYTDLLKQNAIAYMGLHMRAIVCVFMLGNFIFSIRDRRIDATALKVCHNRRISNHKVYLDLLELRGKKYNRDIELEIIQWTGI